MKGLFFSGLLAVLISAVAVAQETPIDKGSMIVGGSAYFRNYSGHLYEQGGKSHTLIAVMPSFGYFVSPGLFLGCDMMIAYEKWYNYDNAIFGLGPIVGYYFNTNPERIGIKGAIYPYIKGFIILEKHDYYTMKSLGGGSGMNIMLSDAVGLDCGIRASYDFVNATMGGIAYGFNIGASVGIAAFLL